MDKDFLLNAYGQCYGADAGPWNLSVESKYLEYMLARFFEENFLVTEKTNICNVGIGAGYWDRYLSYKLKGGILISIDMDETACRQLKEGLVNEKNPNQVTVIHSDVLSADGFENQFDIVTMVGSTRMESGLYESMIEKALSFLKSGGSLYYQSLDEAEAKEDMDAVCGKNNVRIDNYLLDACYGFKAQYWKITKSDSPRPGG